MINALFVETDGVYFGLDDVIPWDIYMNAMECKNSAPAICHPPCKRWGRYWSGGPSVKSPKLLGDDDGAFAYCLWYVRTFGGIIEHPEASHAFKYYGLKTPPKGGGWVKADDYGGLVCCVEQGHYGHKARKATWLYINKLATKELKWGKSKDKMRVDPGFHSKEEAKTARTSADYAPIKRLTEKERMDTPIEFRDLLIDWVKTGSVKNS